MRPYPSNDSPSEAHVSTFEPTLSASNDMTASGCQNPRSRDSLSPVDVQQSPQSDPSISHLLQQLRQWRQNRRSEARSWSLNAADSAVPMDVLPSEGPTLTQSWSPPKRKVPEITGGAPADMILSEEHQPAHKEPRWVATRHSRDDQAAANRRDFPCEHEIISPGGYKGSGRWRNTHQQPDERRLVTKLVEDAQRTRDAQWAHDEQGAAQDVRQWAQCAAQEVQRAQEPRRGAQDRSSGGSGVMLFGCNISASAANDFRNPPKEPADPFTSLEHQRAGRGVHTYGEAAGLSNSVWKSAVSAGKSTSAGMMIDDAANAANAADRAAQLPASNSYPGARTRPQHNAALDATRPGLRLEAAQPTATLGSASASANLGIADEGTRAAAGINPVMLAYARRLHETYIRADDATPRNPTGHARPRTARETPPQEAPPRFTDSWRGALDSHAAATATTAAAAVARGAAERSPPVGERLRSVVQALQEGPPSLDSDSSAAPTAAAGSSGFGFGGEWSYTSAGLEALFAANATNAPRGGAAPAGDASAELLLSRHLQDATRVAAQAGRTLNPASGALSQPTEVPPAAETIRRAAALATGGEAAPLGSSAARREAGRGGGAATTGAATSGAATMGDGATSATRASGGPLSAGMGDGVTKASPRRRFRCTMCDRRFSSGQALGGHSRMHAMQRRVQDESGR